MGSMPCHFVCVKVRTVKKFFESKPIIFHPHTTLSYIHYCIPNKWIMILNYLLELFEALIA